MPMAAQVSAMCQTLCKHISQGWGSTFGGWSTYLKADAFGLTEIKASGLFVGSLS